MSVGSGKGASPHPSGALGGHGRARPGPTGASGTAKSGGTETDRAELRDTGSARLPEPARRQAARASCGTAPDNRRPLRRLPHRSDRGRTATGHRAVHRSTVSSARPHRLLSDPDRDGSAISDGLRREPPSATLGARPYQPTDPRPTPDPANLLRLDREMDRQRNPQDSPLPFAALTHEGTAQTTCHTPKTRPRSPAVEGQSDRGRAQGVMR